MYADGISNPNFIKPEIHRNGEGVFRDYFVFCEDRSRIIQKLEEKGIQAQARYTIPLHLSKTFEHLGYKAGDFPTSELAAKNVLCLPTHLGITPRNVEYICSVLNKI